MKRSISPCFCINLRRAAASYPISMTNHCQKRSTTSQFSLMKSLSRIQPCTVTALADEMGLERTTLVRTIKPLADRGLIHNLAPAKSRNKLLSLTEDGDALMEYAASLWEEAQGAVKAYMGAEQIETLMQLLARLEEFGES